MAHRELADHNQAIASLVQAGRQGIVAFFCIGVVQNFTQARRGPPFP